MMMFSPELLPLGTARSVLTSFDHSEATLKCPLSRRFVVHCAAKADGFSVRTVWSRLCDDSAKVTLLWGRFPYQHVAAFQVQTPFASRQFRTTLSGRNSSWGYTDAAARQPRI